jgi:hydrogenase maturation protease
MLDDGIGPAVYDELIKQYDIPENVELYDLGCMTMKLISKVDEYDFIITVDAVDGTDAEPGTVFRYQPADIARTTSAMASLHELKLIDLFDAAQLLGYSCEGICYGMQIENMSPAELTEGLTPKVYDLLPFLVESVVAELDRQGSPLKRKDAPQTHKD